MHVNVSLDGFRAESHGRFRGDQASFFTTLATARALAAAGLLQGLLCTPNTLAEDEEYRELCEFAASQGAAYETRLAKSSSSSRFSVAAEMTSPPRG